MRKILFMLLWIVAICTANAQVKHLAIEIANAQKENVVFTDISSSIKEATIQTQSLDLAEHFVNPNEVYVFDYTPVKTRSNATASPAVKLRLPIGNAYKNIELIEVPDNFYDYVVTTSSGETYPANRNIKHYRGIVEGDSTSLVALSFYNDEMSGIIATSDGTYNIGKSEQLGRHILYNDRNMKEQQEFVCDTYDDFDMEYDPEVLFAEYNAATSVSRYKYVKCYLETEYDIYQDRGNTSSVESFISGIFNQVSTIYYNDGIYINLSEIYIWTTEDPYTATTTENLLEQYQNRKTSINGDVAQLLTFRSVGGGRAVVNSLHLSGVRNKLSVAGLYDYYYSYPAYNWSVNVMAHEFGHQFGSRHTHACVWNGNNTAIDGCGDIEDGNCPNPGYPSGKGTIMSYCHLKGRPGIDFTKGFGSQPANVIRNSIATASGLSEVSISGPTLVSTSGSTFSVTNATVTSSSWSCSSNLQIVSKSSQSVTVKSIGNGVGWISAKTNIGVVGPQIKHEVWAGKPIITRIEGPTRTPNTGFATFRAIYDARSNPTTFEWNMSPQSGGTMYGKNTEVLDVAFYNTGSYQLAVRAQNANGMGEYRTSGCNVYSASRSLTVYPNPATSTLNIKFDDSGKTVNAVNGKPLYDIKLYNIRGSLKLSTKSSGEQVSLDVSALSEGNYILQISDGVEISVEQIIIKR